MDVKLINIKGNWKDVKNAARTTISLDDKNETPSEEWKERIIRSEHSPIRLIKFHAEWINLPYWVSVHMVRHKYLCH